jgi:hypothetical protein
MCWGQYVTWVINLSAFQKQGRRAGIFLAEVGSNMRNITKTETQASEGKHKTKRRVPIDP